MNLCVLNVFPKHLHGNESSIDWETPSSLTLRILVDLLFLKFIDLYGHFINVFSYCLISESTVACTLSRFRLLNLTRYKNVSESEVHVVLIIPTSLHSVHDASLKLKFLRYKTADFSCNNFSSLWIHWINILQYRRLITVNLLIREVLFEIILCEEWFPIMSVV